MAQTHIGIPHKGHLIKAFKDKEKPPGNVHAHQGFRIDAILRAPRAKKLKRTQVPWAHPTKLYQDRHTWRDYPAGTADVHTQARQYSFLARNHPRVRAAAVLAHATTNRDAPKGRSVLRACTFLGHGVSQEQLEGGQTHLKQLGQNQANPLPHISCEYRFYSLSNRISSSNSVSSVSKRIRGPSKASGRIALSFSAAMMISVSEPSDANPNRLA